uniref:Uncharacterized protein n=1 Tax=Calcidiscus leptoporus TaxID=127549 RepID=A0A7S0ITM8_9EUKA|mmetsp:Transcript_22422/g.51677  ORF Transcript_22422/g.51677 Transcript_22422/m.51677 type:complete len:131 (+) Transcript_22422:94-486(+)|eukprot:CAMPEP_0119353648 /NCGR_PEP_ID=MMETSP1334-20130426/2759_1 /TAXON_ID=127549 /ORGANISM="Calcidiscus leptoporus, Strain RCC1130" /LENGTH=130 /DNA_ID=CAMNT_0007366979 /DNA_START=266 /DNA_END=658 /DNA_ORIENTATION=-
MSEPVKATPAAECKFVPNGKYKNTKGCCISDGTVTADVSECWMKNCGLECVCLCNIWHCLCHTAMPFFPERDCSKNCNYACNKYDTPNQCYYGWACGNGTAGAAFIVSEGGKKFAIEWCFMPCGEYELVE